MCQYSAQDGVPDQWHLVHLGGRASGGFGLVLAESTAVGAHARISPGDTGLWNTEQQTAWRSVVDFIHDRGALAGIQLNHAGRKASIGVPWAENSSTLSAAEGGWPTISASAIAFPGFAEPGAATLDEIAAVIADFAASAVLAEGAGFNVIEIQAAHGFLIHSFLSPLSNTRDDDYGGTQENRFRLLLQIVDAIRAAISPGIPLFVRLSATDWLHGGLTPAESAVLGSRLAQHGVDLVDVSSGGLLPAEIPVGPGYQVAAADLIHRQSGVPVAAVGLITSADQAEQIVTEHTQAVFVGRLALRDPNFALRAAHELGSVGNASAWQKQYVRGAW